MRREPPAHRCENEMYSNEDLDDFVWYNLKAAAVVADVVNCRADPSTPKAQVLRIDDLSLDSGIGFRLVAQNYDDGRGGSVHRHC